jgi:hypothetical protein
LGFGFDVEVGHCDEDLMGIGHVRQLKIHFSAFVLLSELVLAQSGRREYAGPNELVIKFDLCRF